MNFKRKLGILALVCLVTDIALFGLIQKEPYSTEAVMDSLWKQHNVQSTMIDGISEANPVLDVSVYDEKDINGVEDYLNNSLSKEDLEHYKLNVYQWSENPLEFRENAQENLNNWNILLQMGANVEQ